MNTTTLLIAAKQGDAKAISTLLNQQLQSKGVNAKVTTRETCLHVLLESKTVPNQATLVTWLQKGIAHLGATSIQTVKVYGRKIGDKEATWTQEFTQQQPVSSPAKTIGNPLPPPPFPRKLPDFQNGHVKSELSLKQQAQKGDVEAIATLLNLAVKAQGYEVKVSLKDRSLQIMMESEETPNAEISISLIYPQVKNLNLNFIEIIKVYGRSIGEEFPEWNREFELLAESSYHSDLGETNKATHPTSKKVYQSQSFGTPKYKVVSSTNSDKHSEQRLWVPIVTAIFGFFFLVEYGFGMIFTLSIFALMPAFIARDKGRNFLTWWCYGFILWIIALIHALCLKDSTLNHSPKPTGVTNPDAASPVILAIGCFFVGLIIFAVGVDVGGEANGIFLLLITSLIALVPAKIADSKGRKFFNWYCYGFMLFIIALIHALVLEEGEEHLIEKGILKECYYCAEPIRNGAKVCRYCGREQPQQVVQA